MGGAAVEGFLTGLVAPAATAPMLFFLGPVFAPIMAAQAGECTNKLHAAYPGVSDKLREIIPREFLPTDLRDQIVKTYKEQTSAQISAFDIAAGAETVPSVERLITSIEQAGLDYLLSVEVKAIGLERTTRTICGSWGIQLVLETRLWSARERRIVSESPVDPSRNRMPLLPISLAELKPLLDEPGALRAHLIRVFGATTRFMVNKLAFEFPP